jgi:hypothetical protein
MGAIGDFRYLDVAFGFVGGLFGAATALFLYLYLRGLRRAAKRRMIEKWRNRGAVPLYPLKRDLESREFSEDKELRTAIRAFCGKEPRLETIAINGKKVRLPKMVIYGSKR